jgi:hypothetical protein
MDKKSVEPTCFQTIRQVIINILLEKKPHRVPGNYSSRLVFWRREVELIVAARHA